MTHPLSTSIASQNGSHVSALVLCVLTGLIAAAWLVIFATNPVSQHTEPFGVESPPLPTKAAAPGTEPEPPAVTR